MRVHFAFAVLLASAATASALFDEDLITHGFPSCAEARDLMQWECWQPMIVAFEREEPFEEGQPLWNRCETLFERAHLACPDWPRTPRTRAWRAWYRRVRNFGLPSEQDTDVQPRERPACTPEPRREARRTSCG
jgi:hypothetical protein